MSKNTMLAVIKERPESGVSIKEVDVPTPKNGEVLVKVKYASICGTDINIYNWNTWAQGHITPPAIIGHELVGEVVEINGIPENDLKVGDMVSSETHIFCEDCYQCKIGNKHICENMELFGIGRDGSFAEYTTIPLKTTWKNDDRISLESMSVQEPLGNAVNVVTKAQVKGKKVLVMGLGPTGLCAGMVAKAYGAKEVVGVNRGEYRRKLALEIGFDRAIDTVSEEEYGTFDAVLEMSGSKTGIQIAFDAARIAGKIIAFGIPKEEISIDWGKYMINKELSIDSVFGRMIWDTWVDTTKLLVSGEVNLEKIITHRFKLSEFEKAMEVMKSGECGKVLLEP
jgi:threonine 3-dehydrogenase